MRDSKLNAFIAAFNHCWLNTNKQDTFTYERSNETFIIKTKEIRSGNWDEVFRLLTAMEMNWEIQSDGKTFKVVIDN